MAPLGASVASQTFDHDGEGNLARRRWVVDGAIHVLETGFAPGGEALWKLYPDGDQVGTTINPWRYDDAGRLFSVPGVVTSAAYEADGQTKEIAYPNGVSASFAYNPRRRWLDDIRYTRVGLMKRLAYQRDAVGRIEEVDSSTPGEDWAYSYNRLDQLLVANNLTDNALDQSFLYTLNGNMTENSRRSPERHGSPRTVERAMVRLAARSGRRFGDAAPGRRPARRISCSSAPGARGTRNPCSGSRP